jgi:hypothetical protein
VTNYHQILHGALVGVGSLWPTKKRKQSSLPKLDLQKFEDNNTQVNATTLIRILWEKFKFLVGVVGGHQD